MDMLNTWLNTIQNNEQGIGWYNATGTVCTVLLYAALLFYIGRQRLNPFKALVIGYLVRLFLGYAQHLMTWYSRGFALDQYIGTANIGYAFTLLPLFCWLCARVFRMAPETVGELAAVSTMAWHWLGRSGCTFTGCCYGIPCAWGVYSAEAGGNTFPVCWVESLLSLGILIFLLVRVFRRGPWPYEGEGRSRVMAWYLQGRRQPDDGHALPYMLLIYGAGRFFTEFLRYHLTDDILFGFLPEFSVHALLMALVGGYMLHRLDCKDRAAAAAETPLPQLGGQRR